MAAPFTVQPLSQNPVPTALQLANPLASIPPPSIVATAYIPQATRFAGIFNASTTTQNGVASGAVSNNPADINNPNFKPIFVNEQGQRCLNYAAVDTNVGVTNCSINLASFTSAPLDAYTPYTQQWNLTVQRELYKGWALELGYVGTHFVGGLGIWDPYLATVATPTSPVTVRDINGVSYSITANTVNNEELRHQILGLSRKRGSRYSGNIGFATYNSLQATLSRRLSRGFYFQAAYTWSHEIDNVSGSLSTDELNATRNGQNGANIYNNQANVQQNKATGDFDRTHRLVVSYVYDLPRAKSGFLSREPFKGWSISGIVTYQSGLPFSVTDSGGGAFGGGTSTGIFTCPNAQAAYSGGATSTQLAHYLNIGCWTTSTQVANNVPFAAGSGATGYGNTPRNAFRGPYQQNWDFSVQKSFRIKENHDFEFRMDMFNVWNHPIFRFPSSVALQTASTFGQITQTAVPARLIQFGLTYRH